MVLCVSLVLLHAVSIVSGAEQWDHFMFAQAWPPGTCADASREHHKCSIGQSVETWTIHGLWPSLGETKGPTGCNNSWQFDFSKIASLQSQLMTYWPNLFNDTPIDSFWAHEWDKHGTCCTDLPATAGEHNYFAAGLMLNNKYNMSQILRNSNIIPSETVQYGYEEFVDAIKKATGFEPVLQCTTREQSSSTGHKTTYHLIDQIQICLDKNFAPISCYNISQPLSIYHKPKNNSLAAFEKGEKNDLIGRRSYDSVASLEQKIRDGVILVQRSHNHHSSGSQKYVSHYSEPQSSCPKSYKFNYPPIQHF